MHAKRLLISKKAKQPFIIYHSYFESAAYCYKQNVKEMQSLYSGSYSYTYVYADMKDHI